MFSLKERVALVTGASRGLGFTMAKALGKAGATVIITARTADTLDKAAAMLKQDGIAASAMPFDVSDEKAAVDAVALIVRDHGKIDILVSNAGSNIRGAVIDYKTADFISILNTHLTAAFVLAREAAKTMVRKRHGRIINTTSIMGRVGRPTVPAYAAAKAALDSLTRQMAVELGPQGVTVNAIAPGYFATELNAPLLADKEFTGMIERRTPVGRWGQPDELGAAAVFLASDEASYVNGHTLVVDGGITIAL
ncbi:MAG TPA: SDR family oxidoreductase [Alphaproteobacteria bacterium]|nr:SDR family oxidoreductase [Alphaproteobacteria bacterium]